ncbi:enoyl-CoA delta isomerase 2-like [Tubulanus polymorphus]|uniref:enoyl-CoA delta isomerase 2-like n=1 Tax=Tubulanus polymorphus TaxID=672921 RepID=UPI003DA29155
MAASAGLLSGGVILRHVSHLNGISRRAVPQLAGLARRSFCSSYVLRGINEDFQAAKDRLNTLQEDPGNDVKLQIYSLFKQATEGKNTKKKPGMMDFVGKVKWEAWNNLGDMSKDDAMAAYIKLVNDLAGSEEPAAATTTKSGDSSKYQDIEVTAENNQFRITLNRPAKKNAITTQMYDQWTQALQDAANDTKTAITVITGKGDFYCSGNDLENFANITPDNVKAKAEEGAEILERFVASMIDHPKPLIAKINGPAVGISVTVLGLFDAVYATDKATFHTPFSALGQSPEGCSSYVFPKLMGIAKASELLLFNQMITAKEACDLGLVTEVFPHDSFDREVEAKLAERAGFPKQSMKYSKILIRDADRDILHRVNKAECVRLTERWQSEECFKAVMGFLQRKK